MSLSLGTPDVSRKLDIWLLWGNMAGEDTRPAMTVVALIGGDLDRN